MPPELASPEYINNQISSGVGPVLQGQQGQPLRVVLHLLLALLTDFVQASAPFPAALSQGQFPSNLEVQILAALEDVVHC